MQVQKDASVELLLGSDTLPQLGFALLEIDLGETGVDLLQKQTWKSSQEAVSPPPSPDDCELTMHDDQIPMQAELVKVEIAVPDTELSQATAPQKQLQQSERAILSREELQLKEPSKVTKGVVCLLQAVRLPARHQKLLQAKVEGYWDCGVAVFDPEPDFKEKDGLNLAEAVVEQHKCQIVTLIMENASCEPARLKKGLVLGQLFPVTMAIATNEEDTRNEPHNLVSTLVMPNQLQDTSTPVQRTQQLLEEDLQPESETLSEEEKEKWRVFLIE